MSARPMPHVWRHILLALGAFALLAWSTAGHSVITCSNVSMANLVFGDVDPLGGQTTAQTTLSYTCSNDGTDGTSDSSALVCFSLRFRNPYMGAKGNNKLYFNLYQDPALTILWGSQFDG